jgi:hypothetical protein
MRRGPIEKVTMLLSLKTKYKIDAWYAGSTHHYSMGDAS